ncbi:hypothetical protein [Acinetobacter bereziniae]|uniref:hypothetical protein n=1 Tax=Acinetobacter bereziniae TaxID=106648 RepID=UPI0032139B98
MIKIILATLISVIVLVSAIVVFYWRDIKYNPSGQDFVIFFGLIPVAITLLLVTPMLLKKFYQSRKDKKEQQKLEQEQRPEQQNIVETPDAEIEWVNLKVYSTTSLSAMGENEVHIEQLQDVVSPQLDQALINSYGLPILSLRIQTLEEQEEDSSSLSGRQKRITALIQQQLEQNTDMLHQIAEHLKNSALFYDAKLAHEYRMHPAWINPHQEYEDEPVEQQVAEAVPQLNRLNIHLILPENLFHTWDENSGAELIQQYFTELGIIDQQFHTEYHYWGETTAYHDWMKLLKRTQSLDAEVSLFIVVDSEIDQETIDDRTWMTEKYIPSEYISTCCMTNEKVELQNLQPTKYIRIALNSDQASRSLKELNLAQIEQFEQEQPFVLVLDDPKEVKLLKRLEQNFAETPIEAHHYLYCKSSLGHTQSLAKVFGFMLSLHLKDELYGYVYSAEHQQTQVIVGTEFA